MPRALAGQCPWAVSGDGGQKLRVVALWCGEVALCDRRGGSESPCRWLCHGGIYTKLEKAVNYSLNQRKQLENTLLDSRLELTNNLAERAIKPFVVGRKNWIFCDTDKGADASARCYSIIESAKLNNLNVFAYLSHLLTELPKLGDDPTSEQLDKLMPWSDELPEFCK